MLKVSAAAACLLLMIASAAVAQNLAVPAGDAKGMTPPIDQRSRQAAPMEPTRQSPQRPSAAERSNEVPPPGAR